MGPTVTSPVQDPLAVFHLKNQLFIDKIEFEFSETPREASLLLILKWGGELTPSGRRQAEELGKVFRCMYPGGQGNYLVHLPECDCHAALVVSLVFF